MRQTKIAIFASGSGSNCENIIRYFEKSENVSIQVVVSNKADAYVLERARKLNVPSHASICHRLHCSGRLPSAHP